MDQSKLKLFIEQTYSMPFKPEHVLMQTHKDTDNMQYFVYKPYPSGFLQTEFCYDIINKKFVRFPNNVDWDPLNDDTFS